MFDSQSRQTGLERQGDAQALDQFISSLRQAVELSPPPHRDFKLLGNLGLALWDRFDQRRDPADLGESISFHKQALELTPPPHPDRPSTLSNLAVALWSRFEDRGDAQDIDESISLHRQALKLLPPSHPRRDMPLNNLAVALWTRFGRQGDPQDLDESISFNRETLNLRPLPHPGRPGSFNNVGVGLWTRFQKYGDARDLDEAISFHRQALELRPPPHPDCYSTLSNLGVALWFRFMHRVDAQDIDESISCHREALKLSPPSDSHPIRPRSCSNLALALRTRFKRQGDARDLDESISFHSQALKLFPISQPNRCGSLNNFALALMDRFEQGGDARDLDEAILLNRQALELRPPPHPKRDISLNNLALALTLRFERQGDARDLDGSISLYRQSLELRPGHPISLNNLAIALLAQYKQRGDASHLEQSMVLFSEATHSISQAASGRFRRGRSWALNADLYKHQSAIEAYDVTLGVLPELAALSLDMQSRQDSLTEETDGFAREAARCAIHIGNLDKAVEFLEAGRSVFWSQLLTLQSSPFDQLHDIAPKLAMDLRAISKELRAASHRDKTIEDMGNRQKLSWEQEFQRLEQSAKQWKEAVDQVRDLKGFEDFLRPQRLSKLQTAAKGGPVIYLVANNSTSDSLIITPTNVHHIPLPNLTNGVLLALVKNLKVAVLEHQMSGTVAEESRGMGFREHIAGPTSSDFLFRGVLRMLWDEAVKPIIDFLELKKSNNRPTLTWCRTGLFNLLPVHAAGYYYEGLVDCASEYIVSSHTPTVGALLTSRPPPLEPFKMVAVIQPQSLPCTRKELEKIEQHVAADFLIKFGTQDAGASVEAVASCLSAASIVHFACHGKQDLTNPLKSGLKIQNETLTISRIVKESMPEGSLAFLSACETAMGDEKVPDEAMSIGASLLFTGFRSVVATMWRMWDQDGPVIADAFYRELFKGPAGNPTPLPDTSKSAQALAEAVNELRAQGVPFKRWVPFIHMGQ